ncbi:hypothetical protein HK097_009313 [Rhizophlyctis rosea]|uniref:Uncharacterized protein n=1 Tax=Rhizophlyctis rosea TaxID=64517 RepID=A0AAD5SBB9_9FUNG|nr:hypothetical protein HK097_009313 [Rhizophlyctis rosea]
MSSSIETAARTHLTKTLIPFYLSMSSQKSSPETHAHTFALQNFSPSLSFIYFWGHTDSTSAEWEQTHVKCVQGCPEGETRSEELEQVKVVWQAEDESAILVRNYFSYWFGEERVTCWATVFYVRDEGAEGGVRVVSYQETKDPKLTSMGV